MLQVYVDCGAHAQRDQSLCSWRVQEHLVKNRGVQFSKSQGTYYLFYFDFWIFDLFACVVMFASKQFQVNTGFEMFVFMFGLSLSSKWL